MEGKIITSKNAETAERYGALCFADVAKEVVFHARKTVKKNYMLLL